ncbi:hypothetical protein NRIC_11310 [Enterococcus florum]|uniref:Uncharacterized protein n=1 Tax=Enterococcus florum TaxID=2480627 RepID=A0A4P5P682_9ENTE|nr:cell wall synthase accessory phosphoprotein MacP [Enterococcus florum]GCF93240.1 hypothetical protein NRIC_11310 [Enterococcus florum]
MSRSPLVTRSELRRRKEEQEREAQQRKLDADKAYAQRQKEISNVYRKELKKSKPISKTRSGEKERQRERNTFLNKAILIVGILLVIVMLAVFFL